MKKITLCAFALAAISLASCKKERTCSCNGTETIIATKNGVINSTSTSSSSIPETIEVLINATKKTAKGKASCNSRTIIHTEVSESGGTTTTDNITEDYTCTIK